MWRQLQPMNGDHTTARHHGMSGGANYRLNVVVSCNSLQRVLMSAWLGVLAARSFA
jgi:hypothetical protein